ncbi:MAG: HEPN domain-containing protein [Candidatus Micrarchaeia archaeon]
MENKRAKLWLDDAGRWYKLAESAAGAGLYDKALYSLEMCMESALKALLIARGIEFPKTHNIMPLLMLNKERLPQKVTGELDMINDVFTSLLEYRNAAGYRAESALTDPEFKKKVDKDMKKVKELMKLFEGAI